MGVLARDFERYCQMEGGSRLQALRQPGLHAVAVYRLGHWALEQPRWARVFLDPLYVLLNLGIKVLWGIEVSRHACIGPGFYIGHFGGITVSPATVIGARCNLSQNTTIGVSTGGVPVIGDDVYIAVGARLFGPIRVGNNVKIGANAVIHRDIPDNAVAVAGDFRVLSQKGNRALAAVSPLHGNPPAPERPLWRTVAEVPRRRP